jgi:hypothetical protein
MSRLKRPEPFGKAGLTVAIVALVMALVGGAYAAGGLAPSQEKQVKKIAKKYAGKPGAPGAIGPTGPNGTNGKDGTNGTNGSAGAAGKSVVTGTATNAECPGSNPSGGVTVEVEGSGVKKKVCNGKEGSPWTAGGTLPEGQTEKGVWSVAFTASAAQQVGSSPISFNIPLAAPIGIGNVFLIGIEEGEGELKQSPAIPSHCEGTVANPGAAAGNLCAFTKLKINAEDISALGAKFANPAEGGGETAGTPGAVLGVGSTGAGLVLADGTWAVTGK